MCFSLPTPGHGVGGPPPGWAQEAWVLSWFLWLIANLTQSYNQGDSRLWLAQGDRVSQDMGLSVLKPGRTQANQDKLVSQLFTLNLPGPWD